LVSGKLWSPLKPTDGLNGPPVLRFRKPSLYPPELQGHLCRFYNSENGDLMGREDGSTGPPLLAGLRFYIVVVGWELRVSVNMNSRGTPLPPVSGSKVLILLGLA
jgi:hypothetical protein